MTAGGTGDSFLVSVNCLTLSALTQLPVDGQSAFAALESKTTLFLLIIIVPSAGLGFSCLDGVLDDSFVSLS